MVWWKDDHGGKPSSGRIDRFSQLCTSSNELLNDDFECVPSINEQAQEYALLDVNFSIRPGQTVGVIGGTGSAKTTLVQLIPRLYDATQGRVLVGGKDVREYDVHALRDAVGIVLQKNVLFSGTVRENLLWGNPDADDEMLWEACRAACADEFLERMPGGLDADLGQGGVTKATPVHCTYAIKTA